MRVYKQIWEMAKPYYEKGRPMDIDHIQWMIKDALLVCKKEKIDDTLLLPLVILHDVGYGVSEHVYFDKNAKMAHCEAGKDIALKILFKLNYSQEKIKKIMYYISVHDNWILGDNDIYKNDIILGAFTDLDYIWMATPKGFSAMMKVLNKSPKEMLEYLEKNDKPKWRPFATKTTKALYEKYLKERRKEVKRNFY